MYKIRRKNIETGWEVYGNVFQGVTESYDINDPNKPGFDEWLTDALKEDYEIIRLEKCSNSNKTQG